MLKRFTFMLMMALTAICVNAAGEDSSWGLYFYSESAGLNGDAGTFKTTDSDGVFVLEEVSVVAEGINFCVHNADWSTNYGWSDEGGSVDALGTNTKLAASAMASGWLDIPVGTYNVTWNANDLTIRFENSSTTAIREVRIPTGSHVIYNLGGLRVNSNHKGMIIIDGKKYINR